MSETRRVVITGLGAVSCIGIGVEAFIEGIREGRTGFSPIESFDASEFPAVIAAEVHDFDPAAIVERLAPEHWGRSGQFAAAAARLAVRDAGIDPELLSTHRTGSIMGTTAGEAQVLQATVEQWVANGLKNVDPRLPGMTPVSQIANAVSYELRLSGDSQTIPTACSASNMALGYAFDLVRAGRADFMLAGGADAVNRACHAGFYRLGALAEKVCRPFDANRSGIITGEGGAVLLLEPLDHAVARGARIYAEVLGYGVNCDAKHMVNPDADSIAECIRIAHRYAGVRAEEIDYICAHGTGTPTNDVTEVKAAREVFGEQVPPISSIKSMIGHTMGAASAFGAIACSKAIEEGFLPPTATVEKLDPAFGEGLDVVPGAARPATVELAQNQGLAFGGNNVVTIFGKVR
ncbi:beta-ketoacyl-[acyl-carrier-protein] synthase family protein [Planotetraspora sp. A-T 1434]|uniref:beta-ketoacyl-[acyl-carrier-protein] synthase family protein n=1 Tax=Planotetraspora sp. A-T 1434 TaxID=2979219 RepID=UPI0021C07B5D|nr:beta-ketoacyl-[acyl-carrier-protein] synthase family protein [Planotetraspora sp. A-T 1434]MCT9930519.1 beta-ketoacyl-[acyl-carrier-protein] synthase family protein [Planotetraspora sp. A-T 1434]